MCKTRTSGPSMNARIRHAERNPITTMTPRRASARGRRLRTPGIGPVHVHKSRRANKSRRGPEDPTISKGASCRARGGRNDARTGPRAALRRRRAPPFAGFKLPGAADFPHSPARMGDRRDTRVISSTRRVGERSVRRLVSAPDRRRLEARPRHHGAPRQATPPATRRDEAGRPRMIHSTSPPSRGKPQAPPPRRRRLACGHLRRSGSTGSRSPAVADVIAVSSGAASGGGCRSSRSPSHHTAAKSRGPPAARSAARRWRIGPGWGVLGGMGRRQWVRILGQEQPGVRSVGGVKKRPRRGLHHDSPIVQSWITAVAAARAKPTTLRHNNDHQSCSDPRVEP